tara:strand:- start:1833 stop:2174 length:342 start_codon:yes stop_codon:yes gene_type:complete
MNYNEAELCKGCSKPVIKFKIPRPKFDYKSERGQYINQWREIVNELVKRMKVGEVHFMHSRHVDVYELVANGRKYREEDPSRVVNMAMRSAGWKKLAHRVEHQKLRNMRILNI